MTRDIAITGRFPNIVKSDYQLRHVCQSSWNNSAPTGRSFLEVLYLRIVRASDENIQVSLKSDKNNRHFTWRPKDLCTHFYDNISLAFRIRKSFRQKLYITLEHTSYLQQKYYKNRAVYEMKWKKHNMHCCVSNSKMITQTRHSVTLYV